MKQLPRALLALVLALALLTGCAGQTPPESAGSPNTAEDGQSAEDIEAHTLRDKQLRMAYFAREGLNPYLSDNQYLRQTAGLLYQNFVDISPEMQLRNGAAGTVTVRGTEVALSLRAGLVFSDGTAATAEDAAASILAAMESEAYAGRFANVKAVEAEEDQVLLELETSDPLFAYLLDIPLMKADEVQSRVPTASGRYYFNSETNELLPNPHYTGEAAAAESVQLREVAGYDELLAALAAGEIDLFASESEGVQASGTVALQAAYPLNSLVYMSINQTAPALSEAAVRRALAGLVDRQALAEQAYAQRAYAAAGLFNPLYGLADGGFAETASPSGGDELGEALEALGYNREGRWYVDAAGERFGVRLLAYTGSAGKWAAAGLVAEALTAAGVEVELDGEADFAAYTRKIEEGDFSLYIGELKLYNNMDFSHLLTDGGEDALPGGGTAATLEESWLAFREGGSAAALEAAFADAVPFVPLVWRTGTVYHTKRIAGFTPSVSDLLYEAGGLQFGS